MRHIAYITSLLVLVSSTMFAQGLSIRGLGSGMTVTELRQAGWGESALGKLFKLPLVEGADTVIVQLAGTHSTFSKPVDRAHDGDTGIGCATIDGVRHCFWPGHATVEFRDGFAERIMVASPFFTVYTPCVPANVAGYLQAVYDNVSSQLGEPLDAYRPITAATRVSDLPGTLSIIVARWKQGALDATIELSRFISDNYELLQVRLIFSDTGSLKAIPELRAH